MYDDVRLINILG